MPPLPTDLRTQLEHTVIAARDAAEVAARQADRAGRRVRRAVGVHMQTDNPVIL